MTKLETCPVCDAPKLVALAGFSFSISSDSEASSVAIQNLQCRSCGSVVNQGGTREDTSRFYTETYALLNDSVNAQFNYTSSSKAVGRDLNDEMLDFIDEKVGIPTTGCLLEVGAGKGLFMRSFQNKYPGWELAAVEPSANARSVFRRILPNVNIHEGTLENSPYLNDKFNLVVSVGVVEHVPQPTEFVKQLLDLISDGDHLFLSVPNFENNPSDLIVYDHLTRFSPSTFRYMIERAGGKIVNSFIDNSRVPMWAVIKKRTDTSSPRKPDIKTEEEIAKASVVWLEYALSCYKSLGLEVRRNPRKIGIYGTGVLGLAAISSGLLPADSVTCFVDDNIHIQGSQRLGKPIVSLAQMKELGVTDVIFSANPCYLKTMEAKIAQTDEKIQSWSIRP
ncbi:hypothetical protein WH95_10135 [Kiloniella litopenaei]|uniref:C-methyltransferase domain-containing protein n=1 Tax=Kiloniella litopenaei TaxID=1549748 RepID=A0A0M2R984_9PROT|nr:class I SAM-dependent methyltransferase [Kiloniella litopenaei]KKJ77014.1 hypothetical protein WH95_10135 [Kiloniella litopenaei]